MHNKLFVADNLLGIAGGRNIGDEYFEADSPVAFHDLDVLAAGSVVADMSKAFDDYWNSPYAVSARAIPKPDKRERLLDRVREGLERNLAELDQDILFEYMGLDALNGHGDGEVSPWLPGRAEFLSDPPQKVDHAASAAQLPMAQLLTRGLAELKPTREQHKFFRRLGGSSSRTSLHSKVMVFDREMVYIGSMNLDPRSLLLNTESGLLIRSSAAAEAAAGFIEARMQPQASYRIRIDPDQTEGRPELVWLDGEIVHRGEPNTGFWTRLLMDLISASQWEEQL
jgi:putative cardiolipin synthase